MAAADDPTVLRAGRASKRGFSFPMDRWMRQVAGELQLRAEQGGLLDRPALRAMWRQYRAHRLHWSRAWALTVLGSFSAERSGAPAELENFTPVPVLAGGRA